MIKNQTKEGVIYILPLLIIGIIGVVGFVYLQKYVFVNKSIPQLKEEFNTKTSESTKENENRFYLDQTWQSSVTYPKNWSDTIMDPTKSDIELPPDFSDLPSQNTISKNSAITDNNGCVFFMGNKFSTEKRYGLGNIEQIETKNHTFERESWFNNNKSIAYMSEYILLDDINLKEIPHIYVWNNNEDQICENTLEEIIDNLLFL